MTDRPGLGLLVLVADCLPVALAAPGRVAMLHCGWRGLAGGIVARGARLLRRATRGGRRARASGRCCYEVGPEVLEAFSDLDGVADGRMLDLRAVAAAKLAAGGRRPSRARGPVHLVPPRPVLLAPPRRRRDRAARPGWSWLHVTRRFTQPGRRRGRGRTSSACASGSPAQVGSRARWRSAPRSSTWPPTELPALAEAGIRAGRREPRAGPAGQGRRASRTCSDVGLHRRTAEPQGAGRGARRSG